MPIPPRYAEWLEPDGLGGFTSGTVSGERTRRYHALLLTATTPPTGRFVLVNGFDAWVRTPAGNFAISSQRYAPGIKYPDGANRIETFESEPWPRWIFQLPDGTRIEQELFVPHGHAAVALRWRLLDEVGGTAPNRSRPITLEIRPYLSGRDYHSLHRENVSFQFSPEIAGGTLTWRPYSGVPAVVMVSNGRYEHSADWFRNFLYEEERARGLDYIEDLASPGLIRWDLSSADAVWMLAAEGSSSLLRTAGASPEQTYLELHEAELSRRQQFADPLARAADAYIVRRGAGKTIVAGYPWFTDWGRDTFISLPGLCLTTDRYDDARDMLLAWAGVVSEGMLPNRFPDLGSQPDYNAVDASLWYIIAVESYLTALSAAGLSAERGVDETLRGAVEAILEGYSRGTRYGIRRDADGLLSAGVPGAQLTWMDVKIGNWVVTPRIGKPVEVQALWLNALKVGQRWSRRWNDDFDRGLASFRDRFWNASRDSLFDVVDVDHQKGTVDATFRPNQILAVGGLPVPLLAGELARKIVAAVEERLWTPLGVRTLDPADPQYRPRYEGGVFDRDSAYHQGAAWPWLLGPFVDAWLRVHGNTAENRQTASRRFLAPLCEHLHVAGLGHLSELVEAEPPHTPRGCPFQAWSLAEMLRIRQWLTESQPASAKTSSETRTPLAGRSS